MMAGRRRKPGVREPSGQLRTQLRTERAAEARAVALEARERVFGLTPTQAGLMRETTFLGHLETTHEISPRQFEAGQEYRRICRLYDALYPQKGFPESGNLDRGGGHDDSTGEEEDYVARFHRATRDYNRCRRALAETAYHDAWAWTVTDNVVLKDYWMPMQVASLRVGLNAVAHAVPERLEVLRIGT